MGAFLRRELIVSLRQGRAVSERLATVLLTTAVVAGCVVTWERQGWDRMSHSGASLFAHTTFALIVLAQAMVAMNFVHASISPAIAFERDRKSLDLLLASRLSSAQIVLGTMAAGLARAANGPGAALPVAIVVAFVLGIDRRLLILAGAASVSLAILTASVAVAVSAVSRKGTRASVVLVSLFVGWLILPAFILMVKVGFRLRWPEWLSEAFAWVLDSGPIGLFAHLGGLFPRSGGIVEAIGRMVAAHALVSVLAVSWAIWRLRPASRAIYDSEGRAPFQRVLRSRLRRPRPPCGDDAVLWNAIQSSRAVTWAGYVAGRLVTLVSLGVLAYGTWWFAGPAFAELRRSGYGPSSQAFTMPDMNPIARAIIGRVTGSSNAPAPGQARLELNIVLREVSIFLLMLCAMMISSNATASVSSERDRDTWLSLIATPLEGREILRGKVLGALWYARDVALTLVALWTVGLLAGAVHPLGFVASLATMVVAGGFIAVLGVAHSVRTQGRPASVTLALVLVLSISPLGGLAVLLPGTASVLPCATSIPILAWLSLFSYEDFDSIIKAGALPFFAGPDSLKPGVGGRLILATWAIGIAALAASTVWIARAVCRDFDRIVGRPARA